MVVGGDFQIVRGDRLLTANTNDTQRVRLFDWKAGKLLREFPDHGLKAHRGDIAPDGRRVVLANDTTLAVFDTAAGRPIQMFERSGVSITAGPVFAPDGRTFAVAICRDRTGDAVVEVWDLFGTGPRLSFRGHLGKVHHLAYSPDGTKLASGGDDTTAIVWDVMRGPQSPKPDSLAKAWAALAEPDNAAAFAAETLLKSVDGVKHIHEHLKTDGEDTPSSEQIGKLVEQLGDTDFKTREAAERQLLAQVQFVRAELKAALEKSDVPERTARLERLLASVDDPRMTPRLRQGMRTIRLLTELNTPETKAELKRFAGGHADGGLTREARAVLGAAGAK